MLPLIKSLQPLTHSGQEHVEVPLDSFTVDGPNGNHLCMVIEPLGSSFYESMDEAYDKRFRVEQAKPSGEDNPWPVGFAKRACWQILQGLHYLHKQRIAHRTIEPYSICFALTHDLSKLSENEIQKSVWPVEKPAGLEKSQSNSAAAENLSTQDEAPSEDSDSDESSLSEWEKDWEEFKRLTTEHWQACEPGNTAAEPHSEEWNKGNFFKTRDEIELLHRKDGRPLGTDETHYTVAPTPLPSGFDLQKAASQQQAFRLVVTDIGYACTFEECEQRPLKTMWDFFPPEGLVNLPATYQADIFSLGLLFWEVVMLRRLVEPQMHLDDPERVYLKNRLLHDLTQRLGSIPANLRARWCDADKFVDSEGNALDMHKHDEELYGPMNPYGPGDFEYGDIWHQARMRKPLDMSDGDMDVFVRMILKMLQWQPELRPSTAQLLQDEWFKGI
jgi:serine/threonine protein kinase